MSLQDRLLERLSAEGISQDALAKRVGVAQQTIWKLASGQSQTSRYLHKIARELHTTTEYLTGETDCVGCTDGESSYTGEERKWVELLRSLPPEQRASLLHIAETMATSAVTPAVHTPRQAFKGAEA